jgi:hypothetical protein
MIESDVKDGELPLRAVQREHLKDRNVVTWVWTRPTGVHEAWTWVSRSRVYIGFGPIILSCNLGFVEHCSFRCEVTTSGSFFFGLDGTESVIDRPTKSAVAFRPHFGCTAPREKGFGGTLSRSSSSTKSQIQVELYRICTPLTQPRSNRLQQHAT